MAQRKRMGDLLIEKQLITQEQLEEAVAYQQKTGEKLGKALVLLNIVEEKSLLKFLAELLNIDYISLEKYEFDEEFSKKLPEPYARRYRAILLKENEEEHYVVGMPDPMDINAVDQIQRILTQPINFVLISEEDLNRALDVVYRRTEQITSYADELREEISSQSTAIDIEELVDAASDAPVMKLINSLFEDAKQVGASDIHIEPGEVELRVRMRVDGILQEQVMNQKNIASALASRLKLMSGLNIAETRLPQDGRFDISIGGAKIDVRLSTLPTAYGESIVMRLLDQSAGQLRLEQIGVTKDMLAKLREYLSHPHGIILVTGPTGSGKTTTLYGALSELNKPGVKIITAEDPIEYRLPRIVQSQINEKVELSFSRILRSSLRQDPDIIMLGEMRDKETATVALRAALTGHLVLSTLHTNDAASSAFRLVDMGVDGFVVAATLRCVLAQRLVRHICKNCKEQKTLEPEEEAWLKVMGIEELVNGKAIYYGKGCSYCNKTGYRGRMGIFELLILNEDMKDALRSDNPGAFSNAAKVAMKGEYMLDHAMEAVLHGDTTIKEVMRVLGG